MVALGEAMYASDAQIVADVPDFAVIEIRELPVRQRAALLLGVQLAQPLLLDTILDVQLGAPDGIEQVRDDADDAGGVDHVHGLVAVGGRDADCRVLA